MANKIVGYFTQKEEIIDKRIFGQVSQTTWWGSETYRIGDNNDATKFAFIAYPSSGSGSSREYGVSLWCNTTVTSGAQNYIKYYRIYEGETSEMGNETVSFGTANAHGYRLASMGIPYAGTIMLSGGLPVLRDDNNVVNVYDGDAPSSIDDPTFLAFVDAVFAQPVYPPVGQGTVVLDIPANGMNLTFTSALQGISNDKFVTGDTEITITPTKKNVDITISSLVGDVVTIKDRYGNVKATVNITAQ